MRSNNIASKLNVKLRAIFMHVQIRVETGLVHLDHLGHVLSKSSRSDMVYKISRSDLDYALDYVH